MGWMRFYNVEPFGSMLIDEHLARQTTILANAYRDTDSRPTPFEIDEFRLVGRQQYEPISPEEQWSDAKRYFASMGITPKKLVID